MRPVVLCITLIALAGVVLAGCSEKPAPVVTPPVAPPPAPTPPPEPATNVSFAPPQVLGTMDNGAEPSVAIAPDGTIYVTTPLALWRSRDGGAAWESIGTPVCPFGVPACPGLEETEPGMSGGGDADLWVGPDGRVHWLGLGGENAIPYQVSSDQGETWSDVFGMADNDSGGDREWINGRPDGSIYATWRNFPQSGDAKIVMRQSHDGGASWSDQVEIVDDTRQGGVVADPSSNALAVAYDENGPVSVAHSRDDGASWNSTLVAEGDFLGHVFPVLAFDTNGTLYLVYSKDPDGSFGTATATNRPAELPVVYMAVSHNKGANWTVPVQVNPPGTTAWFPWIAAGSQGRIVVTWYQNDLGLPRQAGGEVFVMAGISLDADQPQARFTIQRASPDAIHVGPECRENAGTCRRSLLDFFEVAIHPEGYPVIAWAQDTYPVPRVQVAATYMTEGPNLWEGGQFHT